MASFDTRGHRLDGKLAADQPAIAMDAEKPKVVSKCEWRPPAYGSAENASLFRSALGISDARWNLGEMI